MFDLHLTISNPRIKFSHENTAWDKFEIVGDHSSNSLRLRTQGFEKVSLFIDHDVRYGKDWVLTDGTHEIEFTGLDLMLNVSAGQKFINGSHSGELELRPQGADLDTEDYEISQVATNKLVSEFIRLMYVAAIELARNLEIIMTMAKMTGYQAQPVAIPTSDIMKLRFPIKPGKVTRDLDVFIPNILSKDITFGRDYILIGDQIKTKDNLTESSPFLYINSNTTLDFVNSIASQLLSGQNKQRTQIMIGMGVNDGFDQYMSGATWYHLIPNIFKSVKQSEMRYLLKPTAFNVQQMAQSNSSKQQLYRINASANIEHLVFNSTRSKANLQPKDSDFKSVYEETISWQCDISIGFNQTINLTLCDPKITNYQVIKNTLNNSADLKQQIARYEDMANLIRIIGQLSLYKEGVAAAPLYMFSRIQKYISLVGNKDELTLYFNSNFDPYVIEEKEFGIKLTEINQLKLQRQRLLQSEEDFYDEETVSYDNEKDTQQTQGFSDFNPNLVQQSIEFFRDKIVKTLSKTSKQIQPDSTKMPLKSHRLTYQKVITDSDSDPSDWLERAYLCSQSLNKHYDSSFYFWGAHSWSVMNIRASHLRVLNYQPKKSSSDEDDDDFKMTTLKQDYDAFIKSKIINPIDVFETAKIHKYQTEDLYKKLDPITNLKKSDELLLAHRNLWWWVSLSGTDDLDWAIMLLVDSSFMLPEKDQLKYFDSKEGKYFEMGIKQLQQKIDDLYTDEHGLVFWNLNRDGRKYYAQISTNLDIIAQLRMYQLTKDKKYMDKALQKYNFVLTNNTKLFTKEGMLMDGYDAHRGVDSRVYSYNQGVWIKIHELLYIITNNKTYLDKGIDFAMKSMKYLSDEQGIMQERSIPNVMERLPIFKGLFMRYLSDIALTSYNIAKHRQPEILEIRDYIVTNAETVWALHRDKQYKISQDWIDSSEESLRYKGNFDSESQASGIDLMIAALLVSELE